MGIYGDVLPMACVQLTSSISISANFIAVFSPADISELSG